jgi:hypothetical protein
VLALLKSEASVVSWLASLVFPSAVAVEAALVRLVAISAITDLYFVGSDCWSFWSVLSNSAKGESWDWSDEVEDKLLVVVPELLVVELVASILASRDCT